MFVGVVKFNRMLFILSQINEKPLHHNLTSQQTFARTSQQSNLFETAILYKLIMPNNT